MEPVLKPRRYQRKRTKGFRLPHGTTCVTRPGKWGNPFETAAEFRQVMTLLASGLFSEAQRLCTDEQYARMRYIASNIELLRGFNLACFCCLNSDCHADVLLEFANK